MSPSPPVASENWPNIFGNLAAVYYASCMNLFDIWLTFFNKNREAFDHTRNTSEDNYKLYMAGYEKAKQDMGIKSWKPAHDPSSYIF